MKRAPKEPAETLFADTLCARALRYLARMTAEGRTVEQSGLVAFGRFCTNGRYWRRGYLWIVREPHPDRIARTKTVPWSREPVPVPGRNVVRWVGPTRADAAAALSDVALQRAYETLERTTTDGSLYSGPTEEWWLEAVRVEIAIRAANIGKAAA